ncbi:hypothetical protein [Kibdelosporangium aridum]|uniref:hypothetical protein n=1 Tax=Kibdelosporangium aridum TaxID=2030 RepID=UPI0035E72C90
MDKVVDRTRMVAAQCQRVPQRDVSCPGTPDAAASTGAQAKGMTAEADFSRLFTPFWP